MPDEQVTEIKGFRVSLDNVIKSYVASMYFDGDMNKRPDPSEYKYYVDPVNKLVFLDLKIPLKE